MIFKSFHPTQQNIAYRTHLLRSFAREVWYTSLPLLPVLPRGCGTRWRKFAL